MNDKKAKNLFVIESTNEVSKIYTCPKTGIAYILVVDPMLDLLRAKDDIIRTKDEYINRMNLQLQVIADHANAISQQLGTA